MTFCTGFSVRIGDFVPLLLILLLTPSAASMPLWAPFAFLPFRDGGGSGETFVLDAECIGDALVGEPFADCGVAPSGDVELFESFGL